MSRFYITTPIYYVNAVPHLGTFYSTVVADALARYHRARDGKENVFFLTGLDEHGQKIERIAREKGMEPQAYCDEHRREVQGDVAARRDHERRLHPHDASRATRRRSPRCGSGWQAAGDIYQAEYDGMYCVGCESAKTEDDVDHENGQKVCTIHRTPVERVKEKNYFFRLSKYAQQLLDWYDQTPSPVQPESRRNEVRAFVEGGLRDLSVSRLKKSVELGHPGPRRSRAHDLRLDRRAHQLPDRPGRTRRGRARHGQGGVLGGVEPPDRQGHPALPRRLLAGDADGARACRRPEQIFCHGYLTVKGQKISKSMPRDQGRPERHRRRAGRRSAALLRAARVHARRRRRLHLRGAVPALRVRPRQRPRQPLEPHRSRWRTSSSPARSTGCNPYPGADRPA